MDLGGRLDGILRSIDRPIVALSGGVDSGLLYAAAVAAHPGRALGVSARTPSLSVEERESIETTVREVGGRHRWVTTEELADPRYRANGTDRCFWCKEALFAALEIVRSDEGGGTLCYGETVDDAGDHRPGAASARFRGVRAPLAEAGMTKEDIRALARARGLSAWNRPAAPCLSSRVAFGVPVTRDRLGRIEAGEAFLRGEGLRILRLRDLGREARVEVSASATEGLLGSPRWSRIATRLTALGWAEVRLDPKGYRRGALHE